MSRKPSALTVMNAADLLLCAISEGVIRVEPASREFCFDGIRYSIGKGLAGRWVGIVEVIGKDRLIKALTKASP